MKIYLAGPIHGHTDEQCKAWRHSARASLECVGHEIVDPMDRDYRGVEDENAENLVAEDKEAIESSDAVLVNANAPSWGTAMEVMYATSFGKQVVAFATHASSPTISPWLRCHTHAIYESLNAALCGIATGSCAGMR